MADEAEHVCPCIAAMHGGAHQCRPALVPSPSHTHPAMPAQAWDPDTLTWDWPDNPTEYSECDAGERALWCRR